MIDAKEKAPSTAATVQSASENYYQLNNTTKEAVCKLFPDIDDTGLRVLTKIVHMEKSHYQDGLESKPYCNKFTYAGYIAAYGEPARDDKDTPILHALYDLCDKMFRESWERGRADARADARDSIPMGVQR